MCIYIYIETYIYVYIYIYTYILPPSWALPSWGGALRHGRAGLPVMRWGGALRCGAAKGPCRGARQRSEELECSNAGTISSTTND